MGHCWTDREKEDRNRGLLSAPYDVWKTATNRGDNKTAGVGKEYRKLAQDGHPM